MGFLHFSIDGLLSFFKKNIWNNVVILSFHIRELNLWIFCLFIACWEYMLPYILEPDSKLMRNKTSLEMRSTLSVPGSLMDIDVFPRNIDCLPKMKYCFSNEFNIF